MKESNYKCSHTDGINDTTARPAALWVPSRAPPRLPAPCPPLSPGPRGPHVRRWPCLGDQPHGSALRWPCQGSSPSCPCPKRQRALSGVAHLRPSAARKSSPAAEIERWALKSLSAGGLRLLDGKLPNPQRGLAGIKVRRNRRKAGDLREG